MLMTPSEAAAVLASNSSTPEQRQRASRLLNRWRKVRAVLIGAGLVFAGWAGCYLAMKARGYEVPQAVAP